MRILCAAILVLGLGTPAPAQDASELTARFVVTAEAKGKNSAPVLTREDIQVSQDYILTVDSTSKLNLISMASSKLTRSLKSTTVKCIPNNVTHVLSAGQNSIYGLIYSDKKDWENAIYT